MVSATFYVYIITLPLLVLANGLIAGLTLGLLSLDETKLTVLQKSGTTAQKIAATRIHPLRSNPHLLLATLLLGNTVINETLPILLQNVVSNQWIAVLISVALVLTFAELIPQALCTHYGLQIGSQFAWFVYILRVVFYPFAWPIAKLLDIVLGPHEGALYKKAELKEFVILHGENHGGDLSPDEVKIVQGTLTLHGKTVNQVMTRLDHVFMLEADDILDRDTLQSIADAGHSRIPVYERSLDNVLGIILVKNLILLDKNDSTVRVRDLELNMAKKMPENTNLFDAINYFQEGASHLAIVTCKDGHIIGICTLEDCIEEILLEEVWDESDQYTDNTHTTRVPRIPRKPRSERKQKITIGSPSA
jgi:metal transporter CNNM